MIPKIIHQLYIGDMPEWQQPLCETWVEMHPGWEYWWWSAEDLAPPAKPWRNQDLVDRAAEIAPGHEGQFVADVLRYEILYRHGGVWVDTDFECLRPIDPLCDPRASNVMVVDAEGRINDKPGVWMAWEIPVLWLGNAIIGAEPGHHLLEAAINLLPPNVERYAGRAVTKLSGPQYLTPIARRHGCTIYPKEWFYPFDWRQVEEFPLGSDTSQFSDAYGIHWWANRRRRFET